MALDSKEKGGTQCEYIGPTMHSDGLPPNPSDEIFAGGRLTRREFPSVTGRRPFTETTKPPLHFSDGQGPEVVRKGGKDE